MIFFHHDGPSEILTNRRLLSNDIGDFLKDSLRKSKFRSANNWNVKLGETLLFDSAGIKLLADSIKNYSGQASQLGFSLKLSSEAQRDYYSHNPILQNGCVVLPIEAIRTNHTGDPSFELIEISPTELSTEISFPVSLAPPDFNRTPLALLMPYCCSHDLLFANQVAIISNLAEKVTHAPWSWFRALFARRRGALRKRIPLYWNKIDSSAQIHPTAVVEGSIIGADCHIGAHSVVRYSVLGKGVKLHDGAKVEYSVVDDRSWLMHDLVLYRSVAESDVFLIHGPYQFSYFQHSSAAFATIMMDYRPDAREISITTPSGIRKYKGRFLGALLEERAHVFGGTLTAPGITIPVETDVYASINVVRAKDLI